MKDFITDKITNFFNSFNNSNLGYSGKKLTILVAMLLCFTFPIVTWCYWANKHNDWSLLTGILTIVAGLITALFGVNLYDKFKNGNSDKPKVD